MNLDLQAQIDRTPFPPGIRVSTYHEGADDTVFRVMQRDQETKRGLELVLEGAAVRMYGEGPSVATVLQQLQKRVERGLPVVEPGQEYERVVFVGD